ncbi:MAG: cupin domain-containing protein [Campylobacterota bacterium]|nr:cupin domain-containing protein [Campylobacterota bacterium]
MQRVNLLEELIYSDECISINELMQTPCSKEIRIVMQTNQVMRDHASEYPITMGVLEGRVKLTIADEEHFIKRGELIALEADTVHHLEAVENSVLHLTLFTATEEHTDG